MASQTVIVGGYKIWRQGFLLKAPSRGTMRRRLERYWFVLFEQKDLMAFLYFQDEDHFLERKKNKGFFRFDDATSVDVVKDYMGKKNAFCIVTPRNKYYIVSESRYELHQWIYVIHNALDDFRKRHSQTQKPPSRPRPTSSGGTPTHKASPRVKPSRPAPPAPKLKKSMSQIEEPTNEPSGAFTAEEPPTFDEPTLVPSTPLDNIVAGLLADAHHMQDVEYEMTEEEPQHYRDVSPPESEAQVAVEDSPSAVNGVDEARSDRETSEERDKCSWDQLTGSSDNITDRSTIPMDRASNKKRNRKQTGSLKAHRSVSPPNLPPPPPPQGEDSPEKQALKSPQKLTALQNFESELDQISRELIQKPKASRPPIPARTTSLPPDRVPDGVGEYMDEAFHQEDLGNISPEPPPEDAFRKPPQLPPEVSDANLTTADDGQDVSRKGDTPTGHRRQVAFEGSATKRPDPSYEPRIDKESLPSSVAEAKKQLFGNQETETARYRKLNTNNNNDSGESASPGTPKRSTSVSDELFESIESALKTTDYMEKQSMDSKGQGLWPAMLAGSQGASLEQDYGAKSSPQQLLSKDRRPMGLSRSSERLHRVDPQTTSPTHYSPGLQLKRHESQPRSVHPGSGGLRSGKGKRGQPDYSTLPTWSQLKASGMQVSVESNSQTQKTVYRSLV